MAEGTGQRRTFTQDEVNAILARAVERQHATGGELTYDELVDVAGQAGISREAVEAAVREVDEAAPAPLAAPEGGEVRSALTERTWKARRAFATHFTVFTMVNVLLAFINWATWRQGGFLWCVIPALAWGIVIATHFTRLMYGHFFPDPRGEGEAREKLGARAPGRGLHEGRDEVRVGGEKARVEVGEGDEGEGEGAGEARAKAARRS